MSNSRQFLLPLNYDITKPIYLSDQIVRKREYLMDDMKSVKQYHQLHTNIYSNESNFPSDTYADKLRRRAKFR